MENGIRNRAVLCLELLGVLLLLVGSWAWLAASMASAAEAHVFDPKLSLTGGCSTSALDPVPDPGCPGLPHKPGSFNAPAGVVTDSYGNLFISSEKGSEARIDIFDPAGQFLTQILVPTGAGSLAIDSNGNLFAVVGTPKEAQVVRYEHTGTYEPEIGKLEYGAPSEFVAKAYFTSAMAIDRTNDHLFVHYGGYVSEYGSAAEENKLLFESIGKGIIKENFDQVAMAVDAVKRRIYVGEAGVDPVSVVKVFDLDAPHELLFSFDGSEVPGGLLGRLFSLAVNEATGNLFLYSESKAVFEFDEDGKYLQSIQHGFEYTREQKITVDNGPNSPNGVLNPDGRYLFVPSHPTGTGHVFAFGPAPKQCPPEVKSTAFADVSEIEAELQATINPCGEVTSYVFEYTTKESFEEDEFNGAQIAGEGQLPPGETPVAVEAAAGDLLPGTTYRFRVVAENSKGSDEGEGEFATYPAADLPEGCSNTPFRVQLSAALPDCRAYELVTPADTNARIPIGVGHLGVYFATREASPDGSRVSFVTEGGSIPGTEGTGSYAGDPYLASRGPGGWDTDAAGPNGAEVTDLLPGSTSPDQGYSFWKTASGEGSGAIGGKPASYVRYPDGTSELVGRGSFATDQEAAGKLISEDGGHILFVSQVQLEESAPPSGTRVVYDRTADEVTRIVSLLPGGGSPGAGQNASYVGASLDGEGVAFSIGKTLYLRHDNEETYEIGDSVTFAGIAEGGERIFYVKEGKLLAFDVEAGVIEFNSTGTAVPVNVSADGTAAYLVSATVLTAEPNPTGEFASPGAQNLYLSREGTIDFVGTVTERDVKGVLEPGFSLRVEGLGLWTEAVGPGSSESAGRYPVDPSRTTPDGNVMVFESRAPLTGFASEGHAQVYRYDSVGGSLSCISCNPTLAPATSDASLQSIAQAKNDPEPFSAYAMISNLRADGRRAFFQSEEPLVPDDNDGLQDVYEWEDQGVGSCKQAGGCVYLISSGHSDRVDYLYAVSDSGDDVFFRTSDLLLGLDGDRTPSIYDARVGGGFAEPEEEVCVGEGCKPGLTSAPILSTPGMLPSTRPANAAPPRGCPKGKRKVKKNGKVRCVKKSRKKQRKAGSSRKGAGK